MENLYLPPSLQIERGTIERGISYYVLLPKEQREPLPAVLLLHGYTDTKYEPYNIALRLAQRGFIACGIDAWNHGERQQEPFPQEWPERGNFLLRVFQESVPDVLTTLQWLAERPEVRADALGITGVSMGGAIAHSVLTKTDQVGAAVCFISSGDWSWIIRRSDDPELIRFAEQENPIRHADRYPPAALLLLNGGQDKSIPLDSARLTYDTLRPAYASSPELLRFEIDEQAGHRVNVEMGRTAVAWLQEHLQKR